MGLSARAIWSKEMKRNDAPPAGTLANQRSWKDKNYLFLLDAFDIDGQILNFQFDHRLIMIHSAERISP